MKNYCTIKHNIRGRVRFCIKEASYKEAPLLFIQEKLMTLGDIESVRINPKCNALAIRYNREMQLQTLMDTVNAYMRAYLVKFIQKDTKHALKPAYKVSCCVECAQKACDSKQSRSGDLTRPALIRFTTLSAVMGAVFVKRVIFGATIAQTTFSPLGFIAIGFSLPLLKTSYKQLKKKRVTLEGFLGVGAIAATFAGEALTAFEILWINSGAELLTAWVTERSRKSISHILDITSHHTFVLQEGVEIEKKVTDLKEGDIVVLHTGEKICIDGVIIDGEGFVDESPITGRADFVPKGKDDTVLAGTFVRQGLIYVRANKVGDKTYLARILCLVEDSLAHKAPIESLADKLAKNMMILGFVATGTTFLLTASLWRAFTVMLVMACPCATVLSASTAVNASINTAARRNILIKGGRYIEEVGKVNCVCFDKTGTLTTSEPKLVEISLFKAHKTYIDLAKHIAQDEADLEAHERITEAVKSSSVKILATEDFTNLYDAENALLQLVLSTEMHNHHPIAQAIKLEAQHRNIEPIAHTSCEYKLGMGMKAVIHGHEITVGNQKLMRENNIAVDTENTLFMDKLNYLQKRGYTVLFVAQDAHIIALLSFDNPIRSEAKAVMETLAKNGISHTCLITGDEENTARTLCEYLGMHEFYASIMPEEKARIVKELREKYGSVLMVGDGINDAMALTEADIGIAMGAGGSEVAVEAADITLVNDDLSNIVYVHALSKQTVRVVHQNFWIATGSNLVGLVLGASGLMPPVMAGMLHIVHTLGVLANSSRLLCYEPKTSLIKKMLLEHSKKSNEKEVLELHKA